MKKAGRAGSIAMPSRTRRSSPGTLCPPPRWSFATFRSTDIVSPSTGEFTVAFRLDGAGSLAAFAGHNCQKITVDGREFVFASQPVALAAWAPVLPQTARARRSRHGSLGPRRGGHELAAAGRSQGRGTLLPGRATWVLRGKVVCDCSGGVLRFNALNALAAEASVLRRGMRKDWIFADQAGMMGGVLLLEAAEVRRRGLVPSGFGVGMGTSSPAVRRDPAGPQAVWR